MHIIFRSTLILRCVVADFLSTDRGTQNRGGNVETERTSIVVVIVVVGRAASECCNAHRSSRSCAVTKPMFTPFSQMAIPC